MTGFTGGLLFSDAKLTFAVTLRQVRYIEVIEED